MSPEAETRVKPAPVAQDPERPIQQGVALDPVRDTLPAPARTDPEPDERPEETSEQKKSSLLGTIIEIVVIVTAAFIIALLVQAFLVKPFTIHQVSMQPTLQEGDRILLNRLAFRFGDEAPGDIVVFHSPISAGEDLVKRIVAVAGDRVAISDGTLYVNGQAQEEPYLLEQDFSGDMDEITVPVEHVFVMGDNRNNSGDSRLFGPIPVDSIIGKAFVVYWPFSHWSTL